MAEGQRQGRGCFKTGCLGGLGCLVLAFLVFIVVAAIALLLGVPDENVIAREFSREIPEQARPPGTEIAPAEEGAGVVAVPPDEFRGPRGKILLDLSMGEFIIQPGPPGSRIRIEADYDEASYELRESLEPEGEAGWVYRVEFGSRISIIRRMFHFDFDEVRNRVRIFIPPGIPFALEGEVGVGESQFRLGGLWVTDVDLETGVGEHTFHFDEPVTQPMGRFRIEGSTGELQVSELGNASPREVELRQNIGSFVIDLRGEWKQDSVIEASHKIGEFSVRLPDEDVAVELDRSSISIGERDLSALERRAPAPEGAPTLHLSLSTIIGEMSVH